VARGWESKAVEDQIAASEERRSSSKRTTTPEERERESRRQGLLLSRAKLARDLERAHDQRHRAALQQALDYIDSQIKSL
jgi:RNA polymerase-interacting CarD/CdnL/TRCF family regulator